MTFTYRSAELFAENCRLQDIAAKYGTPCYVYSRAALTAQWQMLDQAFSNYPHRICYAVKANSNLAVLNVLARLGAGFDIVSGGELHRVITAGAHPADIVFSGVGKQDEEIIAALHAGIGCFNVESHTELARLQTIAAALNKTAAISLRVNPDVFVATHPYISTGLKQHKFGISVEEALNLYQLASTQSHLKIKGIACHIGSQILDIAPFVMALKKLLQMVDELAHMGITLEQIDIGGGLSVPYTQEKHFPVTEYAAAIQQELTQRKLLLLIEPGRFIAAPAGILLTKVNLLKQQSTKHFAVVDAGMNDLLRPALYNAWHDIIPVKQTTAETQCYDIVGPVCETGDFLGKERQLALKENDLLAVTMAGAYGFAMSLNYNTRPRAAEIMVDNDKAYLIRERETIAHLLMGEKCLP